LDILGAYHFERIFPVDVKNEERTRSAGLHLWYRVKFDENTDLKEAASRLAKLGEISKVQANGHIKRAYNTKGYRSYISEAALQQKSAIRAVTASGMTMHHSFIQHSHNNSRIASTFLPSFRTTYIASSFRTIIKPIFIIELISTTVDVMPLIR